MAQSGSGIGHLRVCVLCLFQERNDDGDSLLGLFLHQWRRHESISMGG
jgi:hypothetical protein